MRTPTTNNFYAAIDHLLKVLKSAKRNRYSLNTHSIYGPKSREALAALRRNYLLTRRDYREDRDPRVAYQLATIDPLLTKLVQLFPFNVADMLELLDEISFKANSDLAAELDSSNDHPEQSSNAPFLPDDLFTETQDVLKTVLWEVNKCYDRGCYNSCAAMIRRLFENLVIGGYEHHGIADQIRKNGEYVDFAALIGKAASEPKFKLTRNTKRILSDVKFFGDVGAHNRMMLVRKPDLDRVHQAVRSGVEEFARNIH